MRTKFYLFAFLILSCSDISQLKNVKASAIERKMKNEKIQLYVSDINGKSKIIEVNPFSCTLESLKKRLQDYNGAYWKNQRIYYRGMFLNKNDELLSKYDLIQNDFIQLSLI